MATRTVADIEERIRRLDAQTGRRQDREAKRIRGLQLGEPASPESINEQ
ncbi:hypothetical protein KXR64_22755 [Brucella intermedia]|nr:hypothetical protein [Brucella intermedia]